ncbi:MAG: hypothetical protein PUP93_06580 [Rhizonema sp. NSF051]|nr:hypothetical protein [Rhizonema sp. NSF051]
MTEPRFWQVCGSSDLKERCYVYHNTHTFMDGKASPKVTQRLKTLYNITLGEFYVLPQNAFVVSLSAISPETHETLTSFSKAVWK